MEDWGHRLSDWEMGGLGGEINLEPQCYMSPLSGKGQQSWDPTDISLTYS